VPIGVTVNSFHKNNIDFKLQYFNPSVRE